MTASRLALALTLALGLGSAHAADPLRYVILVDSGKKAGEQVVTEGPDGRTTVLEDPVVREAYLGGVS